MKALFGPIAKAWRCLAPEWVSMGVLFSVGLPVPRLAYFRIFRIFVYFGYAPPMTLLEALRRLP